MLTLQTQTDLKEYCFRKLGSPIINIEVDATQAVDRINDAIEYFIERHFNGVTEAFYKITVKESDVTNGYITLPNNIVVVKDILTPSGGSSIEVMDDFEFNMMDEMHRNGGVFNVLDYYLTMTHLSMVQDMFNKPKNFTFNGASRRITPLYKLTSKGSANMTNIDFDSVDWVKTNSTINTNSVTLPNGSETAHEVVSDASGTFGFEETIETTGYVRGMYTFSVGLKLGTYTGDIKLSIFDGNDVEVNSVVYDSVSDDIWKIFNIEGVFDTTHGKNIRVVVEGTALAAGETFKLSGATVYKNALLLINGYTSIDPDESVDVYNDRWIKKYATAQIKKQWGANLKKYEGVQMAGGVSATGQTLFDEAVAELDKLEEEFSMNFELPCDFFLA